MRLRIVRPPDLASGFWKMDFPAHLIRRSRGWLVGWLTGILTVLLALGFGMGGTCRGEALCSCGVCCSLQACVLTHRQGIINNGKLQVTILR